MKFPPRTNVILAGILTLSAVLTSGCDSGSGGSTSSAPPSGKAATLSGIIRNNTGSVTQGTVEVTDAKGQRVTSVTLAGESEHYSLTVPAGTVYPVLLTARPQGGGESVKAVVTSDDAAMMDITTVSTLVVDAALQLGGLTAQNIARASGGAIGQRMSQGGGGGAGAGGSGGGPGNSSGGVSRGGGHAGHDMPDQSGAAKTPETPATKK